MRLSRLDCCLRVILSLHLRLLVSLCASVQARLLSACDSESVLASASVFVCVCPGLIITSACDSKSAPASASVFVCVCPGLIAVCV